MAWFDSFLVDWEPRRWQASSGMPATIVPGQVFLQRADYGLEVAAATSAQRPTSADMRKAWKARHGGRPSPVLLVVGYPDGEATLVAACGPAGDEPPVHVGLEVSQVERLAALALAEPTRHAAQRCLLRLLPEVESDLPGVLNSGLLATHELRQGVPERRDWAQAVSAGRPVLKKRGRALVEALGYTVEHLGTNASLLMAGVEKRAVAVFLDEGETFDSPGVRFGGVSPVSQALALADRERLPWVVLTRAAEIRLYAARPDTGVGRKGRAETFVECNLALLPENMAGYLHLLFSADALGAAGTLEQILDSSADFAADLASRLRERVYREAVPALARALGRRLSAEPDEATLAAAYDQTLHVLFRLLFVAYGEDKALLPYTTNSRYADHSLKRIARRLGDDINRAALVFDSSAADLWEDVAQIWDSIHGGNGGWGVPAYDGRLFSSDPERNPAGAALAGITLTNDEFGPALVALLVDRADRDTVGPVDFRSLSVREFGTIYEGLLESQLSVALTDLTVDAKGSYVPASGRDAVEVRAGDVYLHNRSGARKATGSYFTKSLAVEHLLDHALEPALTDHLQRIEEHLQRGDEAAAAAEFFDFRCADVAMGSGHFLVAAIDRIEARLSAFLALHPISAVMAELDRLRDAAFLALGDLGTAHEIETTSLLRRQVARRCIYGVDRNDIAVELARLGVWIHTFVPGLPLSFLDHNLVRGDSLTGVGTIAEAYDAVSGGAGGSLTLFHDEIEAFLRRASTALHRLATISDATVGDVELAQAAHREALERVGPAEALFDLLVANRLGAGDLPINLDEARVVEAAKRSGARGTVESLRALHFPVAFPEVFLRDRPGFDCILGNPPWEEATVEELGFWAARFPGLKSLTQADQKRQVARLRDLRPDVVAEYKTALEEAELTRTLLVRGPYPGMGTGDPDLYKAFAWRFFNLLASGGRIGVVLPRSIFATKGSAPWREAVLSSGQSEVVFTKNREEWLFTDVNPGYSIALLAYRSAPEAATLRVRGTYQSHREMREGLARPATALPLLTLKEADPLMCVPTVDGDDALAVFASLIQLPTFGRADRADFATRPHTEFHATNDAAEFFSGEETDHPVYNHVNIGHFRFEPGAGPFNYAPWDYAVVQLQARRAAGARRQSSPFSSMPRAWFEDESTLPALQARIAIRDVVHSTNQRKVWAALVPAGTLLTNKAPYLLFARGDLATQAAVLGFLGSSVVDWYGHTRINLNLNYFILNSIPVPEFKVDTPRLARLVELAAGLALRPDAEYGAWADLADPLAETDRPAAVAELDAIVSLEFDLNDDALAVVWNASAPLRPPLAAILEWRKAWR